MNDDVKIYKPSTNAADQHDLGDILESVGKQRANGNVEKARELGKKLAEITPTGENSQIRIDLKSALKPKFFAPTVLYQIMVVMIFAAEVALQLQLSSELLATTASNALHDSLRNNRGDFYRNISDGAAFSFYYLAVKKGGDIERNIGEAFAMLCSVDDNESFIEAGQTVYRLTMEAISAEIEAIGFENI